MGSLELEGGQIYTGTALIKGCASGRLLASNFELSFWGGVNPQTGEIIDRHHPLSGQCIKDVVVAIPSSRGSSSGSAVMLELLLSGNAPLALIFARREDILTLGVIVAEEIFQRKLIPVLVLKAEDFREILNASHVRVDGDVVNSTDSSGEFEEPQTNPPRPMNQPLTDVLELTERDRAFLHGLHGEAARSAMRITVRMASLRGAKQLIDVSQVHIDGCIYTGPGSLAFAEKLRDWGGRVLVPTTLNSISVDQRHWRAQGVDVAFGEAAQRLAAAYTDMAAQPTFTCTPYMLDSAPKRGDQVAWAESNAVAYANSVLGARSPKYPDFLDAAIALTGRAPNAGLHLAQNRLASLLVRVHDLHMKQIDDSFYPLLGYYVGGLSGSRIPVIAGLETLRPSTDDLKAFSAAFGTAASASMFHMVGVTPEASSLEDVLDDSQEVEELYVTPNSLDRCRKELNSAQENEKVDLVSLGSPHFSLAEIKQLSKLCTERTKRDGVSLMVTCGRATQSLAVQAGYVEELDVFGVQLINDTCWCMIAEPVIPHAVKVIMTNSAKYAHYGPGITGKRFRFGSLAECVEAASQGPNKKIRIQKSERENRHQRQ